MNPSIYGYDKHMKVIRHGSIVRFREKDGGATRVGHVWEGQDWNSENEADMRWNVSFNHTYSEQGQPMSYGYDYRVIGNVDINPDDEDLLDFDHHVAGGRGNWMTWTPYPHWNI